MLENNNFTILIVDDIARNIQIVANILRPKGYKLLYSQSPVKALEIINNKKIDLVLLDIMMPEMDGYEVCEKIKESPEKKDIPIIFLTAKNDIESITRGFKSGGVDFIIKPFNNEELLIRVENHLKLQNAFNVIQNQNIELQKLNDTKDKFFSIIAHDLRNPFNAIYMMSEVLKRKSNEINNEEAQQIIELLHLSTKETYELLDNLLTWSRLQRNKLEFTPEEINIPKMVNSNMALYDNIAKSKSIKLDADIPENLLLKADKNMLNTILRNLISNAIKFTHDEGNIHIEARSVENYCQFSVKDTGIGLTKEEIEVLISDNETNSKSGTADERGTGIGLILCKEFIKTHKGEIWIESIKGKGSTFYFTLEI